MDIFMSEKNVLNYTQVARPPRDVPAVRVRRQRGRLPLGPLGAARAPLPVQAGLRRGEVGYLLPV